MKYFFRKSKSNISISFHIWYSIVLFARHARYWLDTHLINIRGGNEPSCSRSVRSFKDMFANLPNTRTKTLNEPSEHECVFCSFGFSDSSFSIQILRIFFGNFIFLPSNKYQPINWMINIIPILEILRNSAKRTKELQTVQFTNKINPRNLLLAEFYWVCRFRIKFYWQWID